MRFFSSIIEEKAVNHAMWRNVTGFIQKPGVKQFDKCNACKTSSGLLRLRGFTVRNNTASAQTS